MKLFESLHRRLVKDRRVNVLASHLAELVSPDATVIDIGSGDGQIAKLLLDRRADVSVAGVDTLVRPDTAIEVQSFDGEVLPFADHSFDCAVLVDVLHHAPSPAALLKEAARVAKREVIVKDHLQESQLDRRILSFMDDVHNKQYDVSLPYNYLSQQQWQQIVTAQGLKVDVWHSRLNLYIPPLSWVFERHLHFVARFVPRETE